MIDTKEERVVPVPNKGTLSQPDRRKGLFEGCSNGDMAECFKLGALEEEENNLDEARRLYAKACVGEVVEACSKLGISEGVKRNLEGDHFTKNEKECLNGNMDKCYQVGISYGATMFEYWDRARECGKKRGCNNFDHFQQLLQCASEKGCGDIWKREKYFGNIAVRYVKKSCDLGHAEGCYICGEWSVSGQQKKHEISFSCYQEACNLNHPAGCGYLGHFSFKQGKRDNAYRYWKKGCSLDHKVSCIMLSSQRFKL